jgi:hypothetical protein
MRLLATILITAHFGASLLMGCTDTSRTGHPGKAPNPPEWTQVDVWYSLLVAQPEHAAYAVVQAVQASGGYVFEQFEHYEKGERHVVIEANVPTNRLKSFEASFAGIGNLSGSSSSAFHSGEYMTQVRVTLSPKIPPAGYVEIRGWRPGKTFEAALGVLGSILRVLVDFLIWLGVLIGPFVVLGYIIRYALIRRQAITKNDQQRSKR